jgi:hypothetical protein
MALTTDAQNRISVALASNGAGAEVATAINNADNTTVTADVTYSEGADLILGTATGTKIGTAVTQKLGFWNATPIVRPASANQAAVSLDLDVTGADTVDKAAIDANFTAVQTLLNQLRADLVSAGLIKGAA